MIYTLVPLYNWLVLRHVPGTPAERVPRAWRPLMLLSGLRGALSLALILSVPAFVPGQGQLKLIVFGLVLVTLLGQGLGLRLLLPHLPQLRANSAGAEGGTML
jgi:CPA1 family monovalent cation:H+ antiporter